jgi:hypothetical protein
MQLIVVSLDLNVHLPDVLKGLLSYAALRRRLEARLNDFLVLRALPTRFDAGGAVAVAWRRGFTSAESFVVLFGIGDVRLVGIIRPTAAIVPKAIAADNFG